ncbi:MAG: adenosine-specific kinase [Candidatus Micrarchaeia archaeon]
MAVEIDCVKIDKDEEDQVIIGHSSFIKTIEDLYEALFSSVPGTLFGAAFSEASGDCLIRSEGSDESEIKKAENAAMKIGAGHTFVIFFKKAFPINLLNSIKALPEVSVVYCATGNPLQAIVARTEQGGALLGIVDGLPPKGIEAENEKNARKSFIRKIGYKL